jgi:hypothetical protein
MSAKRGQLQAQLTADAVWQATITCASDGPTTIDVTTSGGAYYLPELLTAFAAAANAASVATWTATASLGETGTGLVTLDCNDPSFTIDWDSTNLRDALGFAGNITTAASAQTGTLQAKGLWMPTCPKWTKHGDGDAGDKITDLLYTYAPNGAVRTISGSISKTVLPVRWSHVTRARTRTIAETVVNEAFQTFWEDCHLGSLAYCEAGAPVRLIWDADVPGTYGTYKIVDKPNADEVTTVDRWNGLYRVELNLIKVPS